MKIVFEKIIPWPGSSFAILQKQAAAFDGRFHFHPEVEITLIESSSGRRVVGDNIEPFAPGDLVLLGEDLPHQYVSDDPAPDKSLSARAKVIHFRKDMLGATWLHLPEFTQVKTMLGRAVRGLKFGAQTSKQAAQLIASLFAASTQTKRLLLLLDLLDLLSRDRHTIPIASAGYLPRLSTREGDAIDRALDYMNRNFKEPVSLEDLCRHLRVSPATCNRLLHKSIGRSFKTSLNEIRISHACRLLLETNEPILDVAYSSGFMNLSNFNRRFKDLKSHTPKEYRNLMRQNQASAYH
jgi:AraC-like DNA-binding protein